MNKKIGIISIIVVIGILGIYLALRDNGDVNREGELEFVHQYGTTVVDPNPKKVIVFDLGIADALHQLGVEIIGLPKASLPSYLADIYRSDQYTNVGSLKEPDFEKLYELKPDLIIVSGRQVSTDDDYKQFNKIAPTLFMTLDNNDYLGSFEKNMNILGKIFEKETQVKELMDEIKQDIAKIHNAVKEQEEALDKEINGLIVMVNSDKLSVYGEGSRFGIIHKEFGFKSVDPSLKDKSSTHGNQVTFEYITSYDPDYIFVIDRGLAIGENANTTTKEFFENELIKETSAYQNGNIVYLNSEVWYLASGGIHSTKVMIEEVKQAILKSE